jgi:hypothetical protein
MPFDIRSNAFRVFCGALLISRRFATSPYHVAAEEEDLPLIPRACQPPHDEYPFCDASLPLSDRLDDLIHRLDLEEKPFLLTARESPKGNITRLGIPECE